MEELSIYQNFYYKCWRTDIEIWWYAMTKVRYFTSWKRLPAIGTLPMVGRTPVVGKKEKLGLINQLTL